MKPAYFIWAAHRHVSTHLAKEKLGNLVFILAPTYSAKYLGFYQQRGGSREEIQGEKPSLS